jgi:hypothetical protein
VFRLKAFFEDSAVQGSFAIGCFVIMALVVRAIIAGLSFEAIALLVFVGSVVLPVGMLWSRWFSVWYTRYRGRQ